MSDRVPSAASRPSASPQRTAARRETVVSRSTAVRSAAAAGAAGERSPERLSRAAISRRLIRFGRPVLPPLAASLVCRVVGQLLGIALLAVAAWGVARVADHPAAPIAPVVWTLIALSLAKGVLRYLEQLTGHGVAFRAPAMLRVDFYDRLAPQSPAGSCPDAPATWSTGPPRTSTGSRCSSPTRWSPRSAPSSCRSSS